MKMPNWSEDMWIFVFAFGIPIFLGSLAGSIALVIYAARGAL